MIEKSYEVTLEDGSDKIKFYANDGNVVLDVFQDGDSERILSIEQARDIQEAISLSIDDALKVIPSKKAEKAK